MKPVLLRAQGQCESSWVAVGGATKIRLAGFGGESVVTFTFDDGSVSPPCRENGLVAIPPDVGALKALAKVVRGDCITIDLE